MKNNNIGDAATRLLITAIGLILMAVILVMAISSKPQQDNYIITKPAKPKHTISKYYYATEIESGEASIWISNCTREGYQIKTVTAGGGNSYWLITMEKY